LGPETSLERRISGLLDPRRNRMVGVKRWKLWVVTGGVALTMALAAAVRVVADDTQTQQKTKQQSEAQAQKEAAEQQAQVDVAQQQADRSVIELKVRLDNQQAQEESAQQKAEAQLKAAEEA